MTETAIKGRYVPGKVDEYGNGRKDCEAEITWKFKDGLFSMSAGIWQPSKRDMVRCGQCVEYVASLFPADAKAQRMLAVWKRWRLNYLKAGSAVQEAYLRAHPIPEVEYPKSYCTVACAVLAAAGLNPDPAGYNYGHAWHREEIPADVVAEILSWQ